MKSNNTLLCGVLIGEHKLDKDNFIQEIKERVIEKGFNFTVINTSFCKNPEDFPLHEEFIKWSKYLADNKIYFHFAWGQYEPSPFSVTAVSEIKRIAGKYFLGIELPELGTIFGCAGKRYTHSPHFHNYEKLSEGKSEFIKTVKEARTGYGYPEDIGYLLDSNSGMRSRVPFTLSFPNYTPDQLTQIFLQMASRHFTLEDGFAAHAEDYFRAIPESVLNSKSFGNARFARNLYERVWSKAAMRDSSVAIRDLVLTCADFDVAAAEFPMEDTSFKKNPVGFSL